MPARATDGAIMLGAAIGRADDEGFAQSVTQGLQLVERLGVQLECACAAAGDLGGGEVGPAPEGVWHLAEMAEGADGVGHDGLHYCEDRRGRPAARGRQGTGDESGFGKD